MTKYGIARWRFKETGIIGREIVGGAPGSVTIGGYGWRKTFSKWDHVEKVAERLGPEDTRECALGLECNSDGTRRTP